MNKLEETIRALADDEGFVHVDELLRAIAGLSDEQGNWEREKKEFLLREIFWRAGTKDAEYLAYHYQKDAVFNEQGELSNAAELVAKAREELPEFFPKRSVRLAGVRPQEGKSPAGSKKSLAGMSYRERAELLANDPALYQKLRNL